MKNSVHQDEQMRKNKQDKKIFIICDVLFLRLGIFFLLPFSVSLPFVIAA